MRYGPVYPLKADARRPAQFVHYTRPFCTCGGQICGERPLRYTCRGCRRFVPWCFGGVHDGDDHKNCNDCWAAAREGEEAA